MTQEFVQKSQKVSRHALADSYLQVFAYNDQQVRGVYDVPSVHLHSTKCDVDLLLSSFFRCQVGLHISEADRCTYWHFIHSGYTLRFD